MNVTFGDFFESQNRFEGISPTEQICRTAWYIHQVLGRDRFDASAINILFRELHLSPPPASVYLPRMAARKPPLLLWDRRGYFVEGRLRRRLDDELSPHPASIAVSQLLQGLASRIPDEAERVFLEEAIRCYRAAAFRAAIVMAWNLCYDHLRTWVLSDSARLQTFKAGLLKRFPKLNIQIAKVEDFDELKESQFIDVCQTSKLLSKNLEQMLREKLRRRNMAAHPSKIKITQAQTDDVIIDLVENVILTLT